MKDDMRWLKDAILDYLRSRNNCKTNCHNIVSYFKLSADVTFSALCEMEKYGEVKRINFFAEGWNGNHSYVLPEKIETDNPN